MKSISMFLLMAALVSSPTIVAAEPQITEVAGAESHIYKRASETDLYVHLFFPEGHNKQKDRSPAAVFFFGGSWNGGTVNQFVPHAKYLASRGMVAAVADYRVKTRQNTTPFECVADGKSVVRWLRSNSAELGIDPNRLAAGGGSAGGHVAAATGVIAGLDEPSEDGSISSKPNALLLFNPVYDNGPDGYGHERVKERYKEISPLHNISQGNPPTIVFMGTNDNLIPVSTAEKYKSVMESAGNRCELRLYKGEGHGFFNPGRGNACYEKTVYEMDRFLRSLKYLRVKPTIQIPPN